MRTFLEKLERAAEHWIQMVDGHLHDATMQTITGQVFIHDESVKPSCVENEIVPQITPTSPPISEPRKPEMERYPPLLKRARVSQR